MERIKVLLIDDHPMILEGVRSALTHTDTVEVVGCALTGAEGLDFLQRTPAEVVLSDISLPDINGIELCRKIRDQFPAVKVVALTTFNQYDYITEMMQSGAAGYVLKNATKEELVDAVLAAHANRKYISSDATNTLLQRVIDPPGKLPKITRREQQILKMVADGLTNQEIADKLFISVLTVISHRKSLLTKFEVANTAALVTFAAKNNMI